MERRSISTESPEDVGNAMRYSSEERERDRECGSARVVEDEGHTNLSSEKGEQSDSQYITIPDEDKIRK